MNGARMLLVGLLIFGLSNGTQPTQLRYLDVDGDGYSDGTSVLSDTQPGTGYVLKDALLSGTAFTLEIKAFLGGQYETSDGLMREDLRLADQYYTPDTVLPLSDPFNGNGFGYAQYIETGAVLGTGVLAVEGDDAFVDRVLIEFRDDSDAGALVATKLGYIQRDGDIVDVDGSALFVPSEAAGSYYISVKHRNHVRVMTENPVSIGSSNVSIDFSNPATATYGTNSQSEMSGVTVMRMGDLTNDDVIDEDDFDKADFGFANGFYEDYFEEDMYIDGAVDGSDYGLFHYWYFSVFSGDVGIAAITSSGASNGIDRSAYDDALNNDCDDTDEAVYPGASEICDEQDNDCDGDIDGDDSDFAGGTVFYEDDDADGYGNTSVTLEACSAPAGYVANDDDCDDADSTRNPGETEVCDDIDNDCSGQVDDILACRTGGTKSSSSVTSTSKTAPSVSTKTETTGTDAEPVTDNTKTDTETTEPEETMKELEAEKPENKEEGTEPSPDHPTADEEKNVPLSVESTNLIESIVKEQKEENNTPRCNPDSIFMDIGEDMLFYEAVMILKKTCIVHGVGSEGRPSTEKMYEPYRAMTKGELYKILVGLFFPEAMIQEADGINRATPYAVFLKNESSIETVEGEALGESVTREEIFESIVAVGVAKNKWTKEDIVLPNLLGTVKRGDAAYVLIRLYEELR